MRGDRWLVRSAVVLCVVAVSWGAWAAPQLHALFSDNMVLQQGRRIPVWGTASPGEEIRVQVGSRSGRTVADAAGAWMVKLGSLKAGGPFEMRVTGADGAVTVSNVMVGDVWICSGQSNMAWTVANSDNPEAEIANANHPGIRLFTVPRTVSDTPRSDVEGSWEVCAPETISGFSAVAYFFGRELHQTLGVPIGLINTSWGGTPSEAWTTRGRLEETPDAAPLLARWDQLLADYPKAMEAHAKRIEEWKKAAEQAKAEGKEAPRQPNAPLGPDSPHRPANLYNGMIAPLIPYAIQGAIWYQGESNAGRAYQYRSIFPAMIEDWRDAWGQGDFSFLFVQLANFKERKTEPAPSDWAELREAQTMTLSLRNTGMAVIIDIGEADDIHPRNKQDVGKRLALAALAKAHGKRVAYSGPIYSGMWIRPGKIVLRFDHKDGGLVAQGGEFLKGFEIAGADGEFVWADAEIRGGTVVVRADGVERPVAVRYAWADNPECNLYNGAGLPASPFRTDSWPGITAGNR